MASSAAADKTRIRERVRASRAARSQADRAKAETGLTAQLRALVEDTGAHSISCYVSTPREPGTRDFLAWATSEDISVLLPSSRPDGLLDWVKLERSHFDTDTLTSGGFIAGAFGISEPVGERLPPSTVSGVDLIIAPACAADRNGVRLGWGRGYFDRTLASIAQLPRFVATVFDDELVDLLPREPHDLAADVVVTPTQTLWPARRESV